MLTVLTTGLQHISRQCAAQMHLHCSGIECKCPVCHHVCTVCGTSCMTVKVIPSRWGVNPELWEKLACANCYLTATTRISRGQGCEDCGGPKGYRNLRDPSNTYRCIACHDAAGTQAVDYRHCL
jgi:hypothetical protein